MSVDKERREAGGQRIPIKTLVEIGAGEGGAAAFEAESVDVTSAGMHLRTAYLPEIGEPLVCRFEANGKEVLVQGEVAWRNEEQCGGDFGVRFNEVDAGSLQALRDLGPIEDSDAAEESGDEEQSKVQRGTRVRLHIDGLGSPMKARVRDVADSEVLVGSNLEFLKVGRSLDLENVDEGDKRAARIEKVNIEVDPSSRVPQLVVSLRYVDGLDGRASADQAPSFHKETKAETMRTRWADAEDEDVQDDSDEDLARKAGKPEAIWNRLRLVGPALAGIGGKAKSVMNVAIEKAKAYRVGSKDEARHTSQRRVTAPAPSGALRTSGRKMVREEASEEIEPVVRERKLPKRAAFIGVACLIVLVSVFAFARKSGTPPAASATAPADSSSGAVAVAADLPPAAPNGVLTANVPLFGPTPMTTTEPAAMPTPAPSAQPPAMQMPTDKLASAALDNQDNGAVDDGNSSDDGNGDDDGKAKGDSKSSRGPKSFVHGKVKDPVVLTLRMTGPVRGIRGMPTATGFTVHIAGTQSKEPAAGLARRDSRIASVKVTNKGDGSDLSVQFKDGVPAYAVRSNGSNLQIAIGRTADKADKGSEKKTAKAADKHHSHKGGKNHAKH